MVFFLNYVYSLLLAYLISKNYSRVKVSAGAFLGVLLPIFLIWLSICGGQYDVGTDYWSYYGFFNGEDFYKFRDSGEYLFAWIISLCNSLGLYGQSLFYVFYGINFYFFYLILKRIDLKYIFLFILLYITITGLFNNQLNALRQATAIYMGTYALILIVERKKWKAFFFIILSALIEHTMIKKECFTTEWIEQIASELHYNDKNLIEKVIRALSLLEMLVKAGCPLVFKGGTALMLILGKSAHRLSIDIDVICPPGTNIEDYLKSFADFGFINLELVERKQRDDADIPKSHSKFFYQIAYRNDTDAQSYILLDVLYEDIHYFQTRQIAIDCPFIRLEGEPLMVTVPSAEDILGDKLTAFAPNTTGIPYYKNGRSCSMEIAKQLYDVGRLFENVSGLQITAKAFRKIAVVELSYRSLGTDIGQVFNDIRQTALCISTRGKSGEGDFNLIQDGIIRVKSFMYKQRYLIDNAIIDAARAAYLATLIEKGVTEVERYSNNPVDIKDLVIRPSLTNKLNKLKSNLPEAFYYWAKTSELLEV